MVPFNSFNCYLINQSYSYRSSDESLPGLFGAELDERRLAEEEAEHVGHHVVHHHHQDGQDEPDQSLEHVLEIK